MLKKTKMTFLGHPKPLFSLSMTELWERFSFYGIRALLILFMVEIIDKGGMGFDKTTASAIVGIFGGSLYLATLPGGYLADNCLGQKNATLIGAILIAIGHLCIALSIFLNFMFFIGLVFIVFGTGLFKPCASIMVGLLYDKNDSRRDSGFTIFYMGINLGALLAPFICGLAQKEYGWHIGFGIGGIGMLISLLIFYFKTIKDFKEYTKYADIDKTWEKPLHVKKGIGMYVSIAIMLIVGFISLCILGIIKLNAPLIAKNMVVIIGSGSLLYFAYLFFFAGLNKAERKNLLVFSVLFIASVFFWSTFEQQPTSFNLFAKDYTDRIIFGWEIPIAWFQSINAFFIIIFAPIISAFWIFLAKINKECGSIVKFALGLVFASLSFLVMMLASFIILENGGKVSPLWLVVSYLFLTFGELSLSPVGLSLMTQIAPKVIRGQVMGLWFVALSLGNVVAGLIGGGVQADNLQSLPTLFGQSVLLLFCMALFLFAIKKSLNKMLTDK